MKGVNLLPQDAAKPRRSESFGVVTLIMVSLFVFTSSFLYSAKTAELAQAREALLTLESDFASYTWIDEELVRARKAEKDMESRLKSATTEIENRLPASEVLSELPRLMPKGARLTQVALGSEGKALFHGEAGAISAAAGLVISLEKSGLFEDVTLLKVTRGSESDGVFKFEATGKLSPAGGD